MPTTLRDLARMFSVAPSTISRALSSDPGVSIQLAERIREAARAAGYQPKPMRRRVNRALGMVQIGDQAPGATEPLSDRFWDYGIDPFHADLMIHAMKSTVDRGWHLNLEILPPEAACPKMIEENRVDGLLICGYPGKTLCETLAARHVPSIVLDDLAERTGLPSIIEDVAPATCEAVHLLASLGHRRIALVSIPDMWPAAHARMQGMVRGLSECGLTLFRQESVSGSSIENGQAATQRLFAHPERPTAVVYMTDRLAVGGMLALAQMGLRVPKDVSVIGHDNHAISREVRPALTTVDMNVRLLIQKSLDDLMGRIEAAARNGQTPAAPKAPQLTVPCTLLRRNTCAPAFSGC